MQEVAPDKLPPHQYKSVQDGFPNTFTRWQLTVLAKVQNIYYFSE